MTSAAADASNVESAESVASTGAIAGLFIW